MPVISLVCYLPAVPTLVAHDEGGHGLIGAAGLHLGEDTKERRAEHRMLPHGKVTKQLLASHPPPQQAGIHAGHLVTLSQVKISGWERKEPLCKINLVIVLHTNLHIHTRVLRPLGELQILQLNQASQCLFTL